MSKSSEVLLGLAACFGWLWPGLIWGFANPAWADAPEYLRTVVSIGVALTFVSGVLFGMSFAKPNEGKG